MHTEAIVYLLRKTSLTRSEIGKLKPDQLKTIIKEVYFQESVDEYRKMHSVASILAAIYNTIPRKNRRTLTAKDFLSGDIPTREGKLADTNVDILAKRKGIILPKE